MSFPVVFLGVVVLHAVVILISLLAAEGTYIVVVVLVAVVVVVVVIVVVVLRPANRARYDFQPQASIRHLPKKHTRRRTL